MDDVIKLAKQETRREQRERNKRYKSNLENYIEYKKQFIDLSKLKQKILKLTRQNIFAIELMSIPIHRYKLFHRAHYWNFENQINRINRIIKKYCSSGLEDWLRKELGLKNMCLVYKRNCVGGDKSGYLLSNSITILVSWY